MIDEKYEPKSNFEAYMKNAILKKGTEGLPAPQSRMEMLLWELCTILTDGNSQSVSWNDITDVPTTFPPATHNHDGVYATKEMLKSIDAISIGGKTIWTGTQAEYDAILSKDINTLYFILEG